MNSYSGEENEDPSFNFFNINKHNADNTTYVNEEVKVNDLIFNNNIKETNNNLKKWILFDISSTTHLFSNKKLTDNIWNDNDVPGVVSNEGTLDVNRWHI